MKNISKKILSLTLTLLLLVSCFSVLGSQTALESDAALPTAVDLRTTKHLPPIGNQGAVGCCASMAITYTQFTNAYSRYAASKGITFNPSSGNNQYLFSPRFTYNLAGAGTAWVYNILKEQGTVLQTQSNFQYDSYGGALDNAMANDWATIDGYWKDAQNFRIKNYDQVWIGNDPYNFKMTTSTAGLQLIERIKTSLNNGNVVVTGGYPGRWQYANISNRGTYGKSGEKAICYSTGTDNGGHQVSIVGYDDNITCYVNGVTLKGAFLVSNSWGTGWQNSGYTWMMYDSLNVTSQYSALNVSGRCFTMDQMCFLDWRTDLNIGTPSNVATVSITTKNRDALTVKVTATGLDGSYLEYTPYMFDMEWARPAANLNFYGGTTSTSGVLAFNYDKLIEMIPAGKTINDYRLNIKVMTDSGYTATVNWAKLYKNGSLAYTNGTAVTVSSGGSTTRLLGSTKILTIDAHEGVGITILSGSTYTTASSATVQFKINAPDGYTLDNARVTLGGTILVPVNGVYTATYSADATLKIAGVLPAAKTINISNYGFEKYDGTCVYIVSIANADVSDALHDDEALSSNSYKYFFRVTVDGVTYQFKPTSFYHFETTTLYRMPVANLGWFAKKGVTYDLKIEVCYDGIPVYVDNSVSATNNYANLTSNNGLTEHTHTYTSSNYTTVTYSNCGESGTGYRYCSKSYCYAVTPITIDPVAGAHSYEGDPTVATNATSTSKGTKVIHCAHCDSTYSISFSASECDANGDDVITITDAALMLDFLAGNTDVSTIACVADINGDGKYTISDVTRIFYLISKK